MEESMPDIEDIEFMSPDAVRAATAEGFTTWSGGGFSVGSGGE